MTDATATAPALSDAEHAWCEQCPKPVLFEIALQLAVLANGDEDRQTAMARLNEEWEILAEARLLPAERARPHTAQAAPPAAPPVPEVPPRSNPAARRGLFEALGLRLRWPFAR